MFNWWGQNMLTIRWKIELSFLVNINFL
jgi:hypothetical protein